MLSQPQSVVRQIDDNCKTKRRTKVYLSLSLYIYNDVNQRAQQVRFLDDECITNWTASLRATIYGFINIVTIGRHSMYIVKRIAVVKPPGWRSPRMQGYWVRIVTVIFINLCRGQLTYKSTISKVNSAIWAQRIFASEEVVQKRTCHTENWWLTIFIPGLWPKVLWSRLSKRTS